MQSLQTSDQFGVLLSLDSSVTPIDFILETDVCTMGRSSSCDISVGVQKTVSRLHAKIEREGPRYVLYDTNSANGTFINERRIHSPHILKHDDVIGLGTPMPLLRFNDPDPTHPVQGQLNYDEQSMTFYLNQKKLDLTPNEFRLLHHLYQHTGDVCTRQRCAEVVWRRDYDPGPDDENLDRTIHNIRTKFHQIDMDVDPKKIIKTRRGLGYELLL